MNLDINILCICVHNNERKKKRFVIIVVEVAIL